jgi:ribose transport system permease protein
VATVSEAPPDGPQAVTGPSWARQHASAIAGIVVLLVVIGGFSAVKPDSFATIANFREILNQTAVGAIVAFAISIALVAGQYDLSVGASLALIGPVVATAVNGGQPWPLACLEGCALGAVIGLVNGGLVTFARVPSIIATLGMQTVLLGVITAATNDEYVNINSRTMQNFAQGMTLGVPNTAWVMLVVCVVATLWLRYAVAGRNVQAVGQNPEASRVAGLNVARYIILSLVLSGILAGFAAIVLTAQLGAGHPEVAGGYLLPGLAAAFLGVVVSRTSVPTIVGALYGAILLQCVTNGLVVVNAATWSQDVIQGAILVVAVAVSQFARLRTSTR